MMNVQADPISKPPKVTIGMPVYNGANYLAESLSSLLSQTYRNFELIICDNASTDATLEIAKRHAQLDPRIKIYTSDTNYGAAWNYNRCVELASGEYFRWHAHDDKVDSDALALCVDALNNHPDAVLAYPETMIIDSHCQVVGPYNDQLLLSDDSACKRFSVVVDRLAECNAVFGLIRLNELNRTAQIASFTSSDCTLLAELALRGKFLVIHGSHFYRRDHRGSSMRAYATKEELELWFDTKRSNPVVMHYFRFAKAYAGAISRTPLCLGERLRCYRFWGRWVRWHREQIATELYNATIASVNRRLKQHKTAH
jgi:glycosyltransferase involved in cell wall biosynthesis